MPFMSFQYLPRSVTGAPRRESHENMVDNMFDNMFDTVVGNMFDNMFDNIIETH